MNRRLRNLSATAAGLLVAGVVGATLAPSASADNSSTLTVVGTSDVYDSFLIQNVIKPDFENANPGVTLNYVSKGTGAAIQYAEQGAASAMIVHAASLENQYVAAGYSLEPYGRAVFWGDYVLLGPSSDPAGVLNSAGNPSNDITAAYQKVAAAGAAGTADFVSRGGTPGTTVQEHAIWATTNGVPTCTVPDTSGGGQSPYNGTGSGCAVAGTYPSWYHATGLTQGPNVLNGDTCNYSNASANGSNDCYVFTDRGTYQYLKSTGQLNNLRVVTRSNGSSSVAESNLLVNSFHAYGVNPDKFDANTAAGINTDAAERFLDLLTSPTEQARIGTYLSSTDPPFVPSAAPVVTFSSLPSEAKTNSKLPIMGGVSNVVPGTPALDGVEVDLLADGRQVASTTTSATGGYKFVTRPQYTADYSIRVPAITKLEYPDLSPQFSDMLAPANQDLGILVVDAKATIGNKITVKGHKVTFTTVLRPTVRGDDSTLDLYTRQGEDDFADVATIDLTDGTSQLRRSFTFPSGTSDFYVVYRGPDIEPGRSATKTVTVGN